jgi:hypothetical protein
MYVDDACSAFVFEVGDVLLELLELGFVAGMEDCQTLGVLLQQLLDCNPVRNVQVEVFETRLLPFQHNRVHSYPVSFLSIIHIIQL